MVVDEPVPIFEKTVVVDENDLALENAVPVDEVPIHVFEVPVPSLEEAGGCGGLNE